MTPGRMKVIRGIFGHFGGKNMIVRVRVKEFMDEVPVKLWLELMKKNGENQRDRRKLLERAPRF